MAAATFRFYAELNDFLPPDKRGVAFIYPFDRRASIKDVIEALGVPHTEVDLIVIDGTPVDFTHILVDGERVSVYPVFEAFDIAPLPRLSPRPPHIPRFVLDAHLGTLARYLRLLGFDTLYRNDYADEELATISADQSRFLVTRDRGLLKRRVVTRGAFIHTDKPRAQLVEIANRLDLYDAIEPFKRCTRCNGLLEPVDKADIADRLKPKTRRFYDRFKQCSDCGQIYWRGSHLERIEKLIGALFSARNPL